MNEIESFISGVKTDTTDAAMVEAVSAATRAIFAEAIEGETATLPGDMANVTPENAKEIAASVTDLGEKQAAAADAREAVDNANGLQERADKEAELADADKAVAETAKTAAAVANSLATENQENNGQQQQQP